MPNLFYMYSIPEHFKTRKRQYEAVLQFAALHLMMEHNTNT